MPTLAKPAVSSTHKPITRTRRHASRTKATAAEPPVRLKTDEEVKAYLAQHLKPVRYGPKGQPIYAHEDLAKLNVLFRDDAY